MRAPVVRGQGDKEEPEKGAARKGRKTQEGCDALDAPGEPVWGTVIPVSNAAPGSAFR